MGRAALGQPRRRQPARADAHRHGARSSRSDLELRLEDPDLAYFVEGTPEFDAYIADMLWAQDYARANRDQMMDDALREVFAFVGTGRETQRINCHHNFTEREVHGGRELWITRKGAIQADTGDLGVIPGSMGTRSLHRAPARATPASWTSCSHGAGRRYSRTQGQEAVHGRRPRRADGGQGRGCADRAAALVDEIPSAYKDIDQVMADQADLVEVRPHAASGPQLQGHLTGRRCETDVMTDVSTSGLAAARRLAATLEPFTGQVYFSPECHAEYEALGFAPSPGALGDVHMPDGPAYFCSRGSVMGQVPGEVIASAFGVFNPAVVVPAVDAGWALTDAADHLRGPHRGRHGAARADPRRRARRPRPGDRAAGAGRSTPLRPEGRAAVRRPARARPARRSDGRRVAARPTCSASSGATPTSRRGPSAGFDATEIGLLTELYWGLPMRTYVRSRAWSNDDLDAAEARLRDRGLLDGDGLSDRGPGPAGGGRGGHRRPVPADPRRAGRRPRRAGRDHGAVGRGHPGGRRLPARAAPTPWPPAPLADATGRPDGSGQTGRRRRCPRRGARGRGPCSDRATRP